MADEKPNPIKEARIAAQKAAAELKLKRAELAKNVGKEFTGERECKVVEFVPDKMLGPVTADAFGVNFGNPHRTDFIHCDEFLAEYKPKKGDK